jgi:hypothetical protein
VDMKSGYAFVISHFDVRVALPAMITPTLRLERASDAQIAEIKRTVSFGPMGITHYYEHEWVPGTTDTGGTCHQSVPLPRERWQYHVLTWSEWNMELLQFQKAAHLVPPGLLSYFQVITSEPFGQGRAVAHTFEAASIPQTYQLLPPEVEVLDDALLQAWRRSLSALRRLDAEKQPGIARAVDHFDRFKRLPLPDDLRILGFFMILEMLLTHNPNDKEIGDSLSHQISRKVTLIQSRLSQPLNYAAFGVDVAHVRLWKTLYAFRSGIAHGSSADFAKDLKLLRSPQVGLRRAT